MARILETIDGPEDVKRLDSSELFRLAGELREELIRVVSQTGGHLAPNLGTVELTLGLLWVFDPTVDRIVWDVGHQAYNFKLLTGRRDRFSTIRQLNGLSGFLKRTESDCDAFGAGHAGTALSSALGMAAARDLAHGHEKVIAVIGDASLTCGISLEALNNIAEATDDFIVVLNDNKMSIDRNVGSMSRYLNKLIRQPLYNRAKASFLCGLRKVPKVGTRLCEGAVRVEEALKGMLLPGILFQEFGLRYLGPIDGHDIELLTSNLEFAKSQRGPVLLHVITTKGKGFPLAEEDATKWHGPGQFNPKTGQLLKKDGPRTYSSVFGESLIRFAESDPGVVAITAAMPSGTGLTEFAARFPDRFFDVGIAEEHAVTFAGGLATRGLKPCVAIYSTFMQRAIDGVIHDIALQKLPVLFALDRAGCVGSDGPTHHGVFDVSYLRMVPDLVLMQPKDEDEFVDMLYTGLSYQEGPIAVRYPRGGGVGVPIKDEAELLPIGKAEPLRQGKDLSIWALGNMVPVALKVADALGEQGWSAEVVNARFVKPLDRDRLVASAQRGCMVVTLEDNVITGGFGSGVLELLEAEEIATPVMRFGWPDQFIEHGTVAELMRRHGLDAGGVLTKILGALERGREGGDENRAAGVDVGWKALA